MIIILRGKIRSNQSIYKTTCRNGYPTLYMTHEGKEIKKHYQWQAKEQYKDEPMAGDLRLSFTMYFPTRHKRDIDNYCKIPLDSLEGLVYEDDKQIQEMMVRKDYDSEDPRLEIEIIEIAE